MARLIYATPTSLDGYIADDGNYEWSAPDEEGFRFITDLVRPIGLYLYGRKMYDTMAIWETPDVIPGRTPAMLDFGSVWQAADKIVYSKSLNAVSTAKTRLEREFDPQSVRDLRLNRVTTFRWVVRPLPRRRFGAGSSTSIICSSRPLCSPAAIRSCPATDAQNYVSWTSAVLLTEWSTFAITRADDAG